MRKVRYQINVLVLFACCFFTLISGQTVLEDLERITVKPLSEVADNIRPDVLQDDWQAATRSEPRLLMHLMIRGYQVFISAQDKPSCSFHPSCSAYGQLALKQAGIPRGILLTSDRFMRCHGLPSSFRNYPYNRQLGRLEDPIDNYTDQQSVPSGSEGAAD